MYQITINLHKFNELNEDAKENAIDKHKDFMIDMGDRFSDDNDVIDNIEINEYLFYYNGDLASITHYTGNHRKSGQIICEFKGQKYQLK